MNWGRGGSKPHEPPLDPPLILWLISFCHIDIPIYSLVAVKNKVDRPLSIYYQSNPLYLLIPYSDIFNICEANF